jgi:hypothetical protein
MEINMFQPKIENVQSVYSGRVATCCCGCAGKHSYPESSRGRGKEIRGYDISDDEISDRSVKTIFNKVFGGKYGEHDVVRKNNGDVIYCSVDTDTRTYIVYFN